MRTIWSIHIYRLVAALPSHREHPFVGKFEDYPVIVASALEKSVTFYDAWYYFIFSDTAALLSNQNDLPLGPYTVRVRVTDRHGLSHTTPLNVIMCDCVTENDCSLRGVSRTGTGEFRLGKWAILAILLGIALLFCESLLAFK